MTKYAMVKKFRRETGCDKKTATEYLRNANWNYGKAIALYKLPETMQKISDIVQNIDFGAIMQKVADAVHTICENMTELLNKLSSEDIVQAALCDAKGEEDESRQTTARD